MEFFKINCEYSYLKEIRGSLIVSSCLFFYILDYSYNVFFSVNAQVMYRTPFLCGNRLSIVEIYEV